MFHIIVRVSIVFWHISWDLMSRLDLLNMVAYSIFIYFEYNSEEVGDL
jgi:hypothetical protein